MCESALTNEEARFSTITLFGHETDNPVGSARHKFAVLALMGTATAARQTLRGERCNRV